MEAGISEIQGCRCKLEPMTSPYVRDYPALGVADGYCVLRGPDGGGSLNSRRHMGAVARLVNRPTLKAGSICKAKRFAG